MSSNLTSRTLVRMAFKVIPPVYFTASLLLVVLSHYIFPRPVVYPPFSYFGFVIAAFGISMIFSAIYSFRKASTTISPHGRPTRLITSGPFNISRNPIYLGMAAILFGLAAVFGSALSFVVLLFFMAAIERTFILPEEKKLQNIFGKRYLEYRNKVGRWV